MTSSATPVSSPSDVILNSSEATANLIVFFQLEREILRYEAAWLAGIPYWDAKLKSGEHLLQDAQHGEAILKRLHELKAASAEHKQTRGVEDLLSGFAAAPSGDDWLHGLYQVLKPWLAAQFRAYLAATDPLMDAPSHQVIWRALAELEAQIAWFSSYTPRFSPWEKPDVGPCLERMRNLTRTARLSGGEVVGLQLDPSDRPAFNAFASVRRDRSFNTVTARDARYELSDDKAFQDRRLAVFYHHAQEMQFAESLGATLLETAEMPWAYHHDIARHISDEVRHARMGQERLEQLGHCLTDYPMLIHNYEFRTHLDPLERFCLMTLVIEASSFEQKRANIALFKANGDETSARYADYDVKDELLHTNLGHAWVPIMLRVYHDSRSVTETVEHCRSLIGTLPTEYAAKRQ